MNTTEANNVINAHDDKDDKHGAAAKNEPMTIAVSASTLFNTKDQKESETNGETILKLGVAFPFIKALVTANKHLQKLYSDNEMPFNIVLMTNTDTQEQCLRDSLNEFSLSEIRIREDDISKLAGNILYLTEDPEKAENAIEIGHAAAIMFPNDQEVQWSDEKQLRVAFDGDAVLFSDESEEVYKKKGLEAFIKNEKDKEDTPLKEGPLKCFLEVLCYLQKMLSDRSPFKVLTYLVTSRNPIICGTRALKTLTSWDQEVNQAFFMAKSPKGPLLATIRPHIFFDDQKSHIDKALEWGVISAHVPYGIGYETCKGAACAF
ncbi:cytosolic 5'-nucleotidase 1A-like isoform X2 [Anguilla rostrata]|uniref:cytosolic 5'-nucleotidase 1A-like isoform X2 n=1 Tax=Anguilla rostrata TaxID=7938 RepID=UPI0030D008B9